MMTPAQRLAALLEAEAAEEQFEILPFWGHKATRDGSVGPGCLSQWWPAPFTVDDAVYPTAEHWMMAGKARLFGDAKALAKVMATSDPGAAKAIGRTVRGFDQARWRSEDYRIVVEGNLAKFGQHTDLRDFLVRTGRRVIVEASPRDRIWGIGLGKDNPDTLVPSRWRGPNQLGFALRCGTR